MAEVERESVEQYSGITNVSSCAQQVTQDRAFVERASFRLMNSSTSAEFTNKYCTVSSPLLHVFNLFEAHGQTEHKALSTLNQI